MRRLLALGVAALLTLTACVADDEPRIRVLCSNEAAICDAWASAFADRTGVAVQSVRLPSSEALARLQAPAATEFDVWHGGPAELYAQASSEGLLDPHVPDSAASIPAALRAADGSWTGVYASLLAICADADALAAVGAPVPTTWDELLDPRLDGLVSAPSPSASGTAFTTMTLHVDRLGDEGGRAYLAALYASVMQFTRSGPAVANVVASGEALVGVTFAPYCERHDELVTTLPVDGTAFELGAVAVLAGAAEPGLARRYVDFATSAAGQRAGAASGIVQIPTSADLDGNLTSVLEDGVVLVEGSTIEERVAMRAQLLAWFREEVGPGA